MVFDQFNKFYLISLSFLLTCFWMIYGYYREKFHLNHFWELNMLSWEMILICWYQPWEDFKFMYMYSTFCRAVKWKLKCLKQRRKAGNRELLKIWNCKFIFFNVIFRKEMPYWYLILQVILCFHLPFFFFGSITEQSTAKNKNNPQYFCHSIKNCNCSPGISFVWSTVEKSWTIKISRKEQSIMIEKTEDTTNSWHWELMR